MKTELKVKDLIMSFIINVSVKVIATMMKMRQQTFSIIQQCN